MFYSNSLLSKKGPLGTIWVAAHCHKRLKKEEVSQTNISSSVDKILLDEVSVVTYRILGYLLIGVVRIYSKKVEYLFCDCRDVLSEVRNFLTSKKSDVDIEVMCAPYSSITVPERFELDAFDLEVVENSSRDHSKKHEDITLKGKEDGIWSPSIHQSNFEEDTSYIGGYSAGHTKCKDIYSMYSVTADMVASTSHDLRNSEGSMDKFRRNKFSLEDCLPPMIFDEAEERADPWRTSHEDNQTDGVEMKPPNSPIMSVDDGGPRENVESIDEHLPPMILDEAEERADPGRTLHEDNQTDGGPRDNVESIDEQHADSGQTEFSKLMALPNDKIQIISPKCPVSISIHATPELKVPDSADSRTPVFLAVRTPSTKEGARLSKKRKCLYDDNMIVITNEVIKAGFDDPSDLVKKRRKTVLDYNANQTSDKIFFGPLIPCVSINFSSLLHEKKQKTPEKIETTNTPIETDNIGSLASDETRREDSIAPSTPVTNSVSQRYNNTFGATNSERLGCARSFASVGRELSPGKDPEFNASSMDEEEEIELCEGDDKQEKCKNLHDHWSTRTRAVARLLHREFLTRKKTGEDEVVKLSQVVEGKSKKRSARLFYELLVLKTRGFLKVKQDNPYDDISVVETSKLKQAFEVDNMA